MTKNIIELNNVSKSYMMGEVESQILKDVSLSIKEGEFASIVGPSGSGKSTMLHLIGALDRPTSGTVLVKNKDVSKMSDDDLAELRGSTIGFVFQSFNLIPRLSAAENVALPLMFSKKNNTNSQTNKVKAEELLKKVGLGHRLNNRPSQLSGGEKQRVAIARALVNDPDVIVADEPTGNLDSETGKTVIQMLKDINDEGKTLIIVTHDDKIARSAEKRIKILDGRIVN